MRRILCILCGLVISSVLFAELGAPNSLESALTSGAFDNEFDAQFTPNAGFGTYDQHFIYGGLGNPAAGKHAKEALETPGASGIKAWAKELFNTDSPMMFGYYMPGALPMSFFASFGTGNNTGSTLTGGVINGRPKAKTETEWTDENRTKMVSVTKTGYYLKPLFEKSRFNFQYLIGAGTSLNLVTGLQFEYKSTNAWNKTFGAAAPDPRWDWWDKEYTKVKRTNYDDPSLSYTENKKGLEAGAAPSIADAASLLNNLRFTAKEAKAVTTDTFTFKVPAAFTFGGLNHHAAISVLTELENKGGAYYFKQNGQEKDYASTITKLKNEVRAEYGIEIPAERDGDNWLVDAGIQFDIKTKMNRWSYTYKTADVNAAGKYSAKQTPSLTFGFDVTGARMLKFASPQKSLRFNIKPTLKLDVKTGMAAKDSSSNYDFRDDGYDTSVSASGSVNGTKVTHSKVTKGEKGSAVTRTKFTTTASVPMGLKILPDGWKVGFLLGAAPEVSYTLTTTTDGKEKNKNASTTEQNTVNGVDDGTGYTNKAQYPSNIARENVVENNHKWEFQEKHTIGLTVPFEGGAHLDIRVNGSLLNIESFAIQAFIPLGTGKKAAAAE